MARALRFQLHDRLAATVASPRIRSGTGRLLCSGWVIPRCPRERRRSESNRRIEVLQTSALPLGYGAGGSVNSQPTTSSSSVFGVKPSSPLLSGGRNGGSAASTSKLSPNDAEVFRFEAGGLRECLAPLLVRQLANPFANLAVRLRLHLPSRSPQIGKSVRCHTGDANHAKPHRFLLPHSKENH